MVNDIKIPDFNLDDNFNIDGDNTPKIPSKKADPPKPKPQKEEPKPPVEEAPKEEEKVPEAEVPELGVMFPEEDEKPKVPSKPKPTLLFEEEEESVEIVSPPSQKAEMKTFEDEPYEKVVAKVDEPPSKRKKSKPEKVKPEKPIEEKTEYKEKKPIKTWVWLVPLLVILLGGGSYFAYSSGYIDILFSKLSDVKNSIFSTDTLSVATVNAAAQKEKELADLYESQFLRKPVSEGTEKVAEKEPEKPQETKQSKEVDKPKEVVKQETNKPKEVAKTTPANVTTPKPPVTSTEKTTSGKYSIQVSAWQSESTAKHEVSKISTTGLQAKVVSVDIPQRGRWYRVMVGSYSTNEEAKRDLNRVMRITGYENCFVREN